MSMCWGVVAQDILSLADVTVRGVEALMTKARDKAVQEQGPDGEGVPPPVQRRLPTVPASWVLGGSLWTCWTSVGSGH